jgi:hypothetical protein
VPSHDDALPEPEPETNSDSEATANVNANTANNQLPSSSPPILEPPAGMDDLMDLSDQGSEIHVDIDDLAVQLSQTASEFPFSCRCGTQGPDGALFTVEDPAVQCDRCKDWSHLSCQKDGRAFKNKSADPFECDICRGATLDLGITGLDSDSDSAKIPVKRSSKRLSVYLLFIGVAEFIHCYREHLSSQKPMRDRIG